MAYYIKEIDGVPLTSQDYMERAKPIIDEMVDRIVKNFNPVKIILFGSFAKGTPNFHSDVDLLVILDELDAKESDTVKIRGVLSDSELVKDILVITPEHLERVKDDVGYVYYYIIRGGVVLYGR